MIDLHMHSRYSEDGEFTPTELVEQCTKKEICTLSITDHNCAKANVEAEKVAKEKGILYIPGIEIDCTYKNLNFHIIGYGIDYKSSDFEKIEKNIDDQSFDASLERLAETQVLGFHVTENDMWKLSKNSYWQGTWTGDMFAEVLLAKPEYKDHPLLKPYRPGGERSDNPYVNFYWDYYSQGKPCYAKIDYPKMEEIIDTIHRNHGVAVIAHPGVNLKGKEFLLDDMLSLGLDGIEAFSSYHSPEQAKYFYKIAQEKKVFITCGSDYHGKTKPSIKVGQHYCPLSDIELSKQFKTNFTINKEAAMKIEHIAMYVSDLEGTKQFFEKYFEAVSGNGYHNMNTDFRSYFLTFTDGARLEIMNKPNLNDKEKSLSRTGFIHIAFSVGSKEKVDDLTKQLKEDGFEVVSSPRTTGDGYYESCIVDIEKNQIEITV